MTRKGIQDSKFKIQDCSAQGFQVDSKGQGILNFESDNLEFKNSPVTCLGMEFSDDEARRTYFLDKLREFLKDPEFRKIEGFPISSDEDILALSDPPYYIACPNPFIADFIKHYGKPYDPSIPYSRELFATDVNEGNVGDLWGRPEEATDVGGELTDAELLNHTGEIR